MTTNRNSNTNYIDIHVCKHLVINLFANENNQVSVYRTTHYLKSMDFLKKVSHDVVTLDEKNFDQFMTYYEIFEVPRISVAAVDYNMRYAIWCDMVDATTILTSLIPRKKLNLLECFFSSDYKNIEHRISQLFREYLNGESCLIGPLTDIKWQLNGKKTQGDNNIAIHVTPPDGDEDNEFVPPLRPRRKLSTPLSAFPGADGFKMSVDGLRLSPTRSLSPVDRTKRRFSTMVSTAAAAAVSRRLSATIGWCLAIPTQVKPQIVRQGRALCLQYIKTQIRRSMACPKKNGLIERLRVSERDQRSEKNLRVMVSFFIIACAALFLLRFLCIYDNV
ncbi:unnamed protein product [Colias eurytheme]|nr:unnamed protein product [Colias eurytheme]